MNTLEEASLDEVLLNGSVEVDCHGSNAATRYSAVFSSLSQLHPPAREKKTADDEQGPAMQVAEAGTYCHVCRVVDDRPLLRFLPDPSRPANNGNSANLFRQDDIALHLFCGKTAAILQSRPDLEVLTKAGLKNKHGTGREINAALARTRSATMDNKEYFLVREFEANLTALTAPTLPRHPFFATPSSPIANDFLHASNDQLYNETLTTTPTPNSATSASPPTTINSPTSDDPIIQSLLQSASNTNYLPATTKQTALITEPGDSNKRLKIACPCGGSHFSTNSQAGVQSFRAHVASPIHQQWLQEQTTNNSKRDKKDALAATSTTAV